MANPDGVRLARLDRRSVIRLAGPDWRSFLQGLITQDVETLSEGEVRYGALLTPQGRLLHDLFVWAGPDGAILDVEAQGRADLIARLGLYRLRAKVEIAASEEAVWTRLPDPAGTETGLPSSADGWRLDPRSASLGWRRFAPPPVGGDRNSAPGDADYDHHRLAVGAPDLTRDALSDRAYAIEADFDLLNGIDFKKGCFVGQETTSRMKRRGLVKTRLVPLSFEGEAPTPGAEVLAGTLRAGEVCSGRSGRALALMRLDRAQGGGLSVEGRPVRLDPPDWLKPAIAEIADAEP